MDSKFFLKYKTASISKDFNQQIMIETPVQYISIFHVNIQVHMTSTLCSYK